MESWRMRNFVRLNDDIEKAQVEAMKNRSSGGGNADTALQGSGSRLVSRGG